MNSHGSKVFIVAFAVFVTACAFWFIWVATDDGPNKAFLELSEPPPQTLNPGKNAYFLLHGFGVAIGADPDHMGHQMWQAFQAQRQDHNDWHFDYDTESLSKLQFSKELDVLKNWIQGADPIIKFRNERDTLEGWSGEYAVLLSRYQMFLDMPFEEWTDSHTLFPYPNFSYPTTAHRLYVATGFTGELREGLNRLETDLVAWRKILGNARTVLTKVIAARIIMEDLKILQSLRAHKFGAQHFLNFDKLVRPLKPAERSARRALQTEFLTMVTLWRHFANPKKEIDVAEAERYWNLTKALSNEYPDTVIDPERLKSATIVIPFQIQKTLNTLARYYEAQIQAVDSYSSTLPTSDDYGMTLPRNYFDFLFNPIGKILLSIHGDPNWGVMLKVVQKADALLRLTSLQILLDKKLNQDDSHLSKVILDAGPSYYDPFTNKPMRWNPSTKVLYSIGENGKDDGGNQDLDMCVILGEVNGIILD